jgi:GNAT superfamily N-acetyltransferase
VRSDKIFETQLSVNSIVLNIRAAQAEDVSKIFSLIESLAKYEKLSHALVGNAEALKEHLFGKHPYADAIVAELDDDIVGYALFFYNYSTFLTKPGIYIEDIFILPEYRRQGIGKALLVRVAQIAVDIDAGRLEWSVLDWNQTGIDFYENMGASILNEWRICRVSEDNLKNLADR